MMTEDQDTMMELRSEVMRLQMALANIAAIENDIFADGFYEIDQARAIANRALDGDD